MNQVVVSKPDDDEKSWSSKKTKRLLSKKRKAEALLTLHADTEDLTSKRQKVNKLPLKSSYLALKNELKKYIKKPDDDPFLQLTPRLKRATVKLSEDGVESNLEKSDSLFVEDVYLFLMKSVIGHMSLYKMEWISFHNPQNITKTVLVVVEGLTKDDVIQNLSNLFSLNEIFAYGINIASSNVPFAIEFSTLHQEQKFNVKSPRTFSTLFTKEKNAHVQPPADLKCLTKLHLLLSPIQLAMESYPLPSSVFKSLNVNTDDYVFTKDSYAPVTANSPLFAIDCEMCMTHRGHELTSIAVVDENLKTVYHTLVKPNSKIIDYITRYSGITPVMLKNVQTRLKDVQAKIKELLPPDAILCGQSLFADLRAMQMIHPYVIDTSVIYNCSGMRGSKTSLKKLVKIHLNEDIQTQGKLGHHPIEDAVATMKLVLLKLKNNNIEFGDAYMQYSLENLRKSNGTDGSEPVSTQSTEQETPTVQDNPQNGLVSVSNGKGDGVPASQAVQEKLTDPSQQEKTPYKRPKNIPIEQEGFFEQLARYSKKTCLIGDESNLVQYGPNFPNQFVNTKTKSSVKKIVKSTLKHMNNYDFVVSHMKIDSPSAENLPELNNSIKSIYDKCGNRTMFTVLFSGVNLKSFSDIKDCLFFAKVKLC